MSATMHIREDEEPLLEPKQTFIRQSAFRTSVRRSTHSSLGYHSGFKNLLDPNSSLGIAKKVSPFINTEKPLDKIHEGFPVERSPHLSSSENSHIDYLPPLSPNRTYNFTSQRKNHDTQRRTQRIDIPSHSSGPPSPSPRSPSVIIHKQHPLKPHFYAHSIFFPNTNSDTNFTSVNQTEQECMPHSQNATGMYKNVDNTFVNEPRNQRMFSSLRVPASPSPHRKKTPPAIFDNERQMHNVSQHQEPKKKIATLLKRCSSPALFRSTTPIEEKSSYEIPKSFGPSVNTLPSPKSFRRNQQVQNTPQETTFKRFGSFPIQRKQVCHTNPYLSSPTSGKHPEPDYKTRPKLVTFRRPATPTLPSCIADTNIAKDSRSHFKESAHQREDANCFALLPTSRPTSSSSEDIISDLNTVSIPIQLDPKYDRMKSRRKTTQVTNTTASSNTVETNLESCSAIILQRAQSLPVARRKEMAANGASAAYKQTVDVEDEKEVRSVSLNVPTPRTDKFISSLQHTLESAAEDTSTSSSTVSSTYEIPESEVVRSRGTIKSLEYFVSNNSENSTRLEGNPRKNCATDENSKLSRDLSRCSSMSSVSSGPDIYQCIDVNLQEHEANTRDLQSNAAHIDYLLLNDKDYISCLERMLEDYDKMNGRTPSHIRQHFDVAFKTLSLIHHFQKVLHSAAEQAGTNLALLADVFSDEQFQCYSHYMVITPTVQRNFHRYSNYFDEHFPNLKRDVLKPSLRLNFYIMMLESLKKGAGEFEEMKLNDATEYLIKLKCRANTEMTITSVVNSPVDLRLCGNMKMIGELSCFGGGPLQKRKYHVILFENLLIVTSSKLSFFKYKIHYRLEQLEAVKPVEDDLNEFHLKVLTEGQSNEINFKFKVQLPAQRSKWIEELQNVISQTTVKYSRNSIPKSVINSRYRAQMLPLSLYIAFPQLLSVMTQEKHTMQPLPYEELCIKFISRERTYIRQLASYLNPEVLNPSDSLTSLFEKLYHLHNKKLLPRLEQCQQRSFEDILSIFLDHLSLFKLYLDYFVVRCQVHNELERTTEASLYISPLQHFMFYMDWLKQARLNPKYRDMTSEALHTLEEYVLGAQVRLLSESITQGKIDFYRSGNLLRADSLEVKTRQKGVNEGLYHVLLFEKIIILTKPKPPFFEYVWDIWLNQVNLGPPSSSERGFKIEVRKGRGKEAVTFEFRASSPAIQQGWVRSLQQELMHQAEDIRKRTANYQF